MKMHISYSEASTANPRIYSLSTELPLSSAVILINVIIFSRSWNFKKEKPRRIILQGVKQRNWKRGKKKKKTYSELQLTVPKPTISGAAAAVIYRRKMKFIATELRCVLVALHQNMSTGMDKLIIE